jgi:arylsulfatase K
MDGRIMGCMGHPAMTRATPNLDRLAGMGALYRNFYTNNPICCPSRSSMLSGRYTFQCEAWNNYKGLRDDEPNMYTHFDKHGYRTGIYGKTDYLCGNHSTRARVTAWTRTANIKRPAYRMPEPEILDNEAQRIHERDWADVDQGVAFLQEEADADDAPFFLYVGIRAPHPHFVTSNYYLRMIDEAGVDVPPEDDPSEHPVTDYMFVNKNWEHGFDDEMVKKVRRVYFGMIAEVDAMVGELMEAMDEQGLWDNTYFVFSSDHGELAMEHMEWYKSSMYEGSARVPFVAAGPEIVPGTVVDDVASLIDIYPTFMDMTGLPKPENLEGHSLLPEMRAEPSDRPDWALSTYHDSACNATTFMLRTGDWKYIKYVGYEPQLFNLAEDPDELNNLADERPEVVAQLDAKLKEIVDYDEVDDRVTAYDKRAFRRWRMEKRSEGTYEQEMARVYSGFDRLSEDQVEPWTEEEERKIVEWMNS